MTPKALQALLAPLQQARMSELRGLWAEHLSAPFPRSPVLARYTLAWQLQAQLHGGLSPQTRRRIRELMVAYERDPAYRPPGVPAFPVGTEFQRIWKGAFHRVRVTAKGFEYEGTIYASLSIIARRITGTQRSGPGFFGTRKGSSR